MKKYFANFTIYDGSHEHMTESLLQARSMASAVKKCQAQAYDIMDDGSSNKSVFSFQDGETACEAGMVREISDSDFEVLKQYTYELF